MDGFHFDENIHCGEVDISFEDINCIINIKTKHQGNYITTLFKAALVYKNKLNYFYETAELLPTSLIMCSLYYFKILLSILFLSYNQFNSFS